MNTGIISSRYAMALLKLVEETGHGDEVCHQVMTLEKALNVLPEFRRIVRDAQAFDGRKKMELFRQALGKEQMCGDLEKFLRLLIANGRINMAVLIFHTFTDMYLRSKKILRGYITTARPLDDDVIEKIKFLVHDKIGENLILETRVDPRLVGGFVFEVDNYMMDASVKYQMQLIRNQFIEKNRRIV